MQFAPKLPPRTNWINFKFNHSGGFVLVWRVQLWFCNSHECLPPRTFSVLHGQYLGGRARTPGIATSTTTFANMTDVFPPCSKRWNQFITKTWIEFEFSLVVVPFSPRFADPRMQFRVETRWESRVAFCMNLATPKLSVTTFLQDALQPSSSAISLSIWMMDCECCCEVASWSALSASCSRRVSWVDFPGRCSNGCAFPDELIRFTLSDWENLLHLLCSENA